MERMLVRNRVKDYALWKTVFDEGYPRAVAAGLELEHLWRCTDDPGQVFFVLTVADRGRADLFLAAPESAESGERAGVIDGEFWYLE